MRTFDLNPPLIAPPSASIGYSVCSTTCRAKPAAKTYPPYNIERTGENTYRISVGPSPGFGSGRSDDRGQGECAHRKGLRRRPTAYGQGAALSRYPRRALSSAAFNSPITWK